METLLMEQFDMQLEDPAPKDPSDMDQHRRQADKDLVLTLRWLWELKLRHVFSPWWW